jgi:putative ABC transport system ATP-binding protein
VRALDGVSLEIASGELVAIVGPSGSGKSTMLNLLGALDQPTTGTVTIDGADVNTLDDRALSALRATRIGFVFQQFNLVDGLSAIENVATALLYRGVPARERRARALTALERVGLAHRAHHRPTQLSGGEQQRVAIARAVVGDRSLLLADEPTGALDRRNGEMALALLEDLNRRGQTVLLVTHDEHLAERTAHRIVRLVDGSIAGDQQTRIVA